MENIFNIKREFASEIANASSSSEVNDLSVKYLGKNSELSLFMKQLRDVSKEEKAIAGKEINTLKSEISAAISAKLSQLHDVELNEKLYNEKIDVTSPGFYYNSGFIHPLTKMTLQIQSFFKVMGYDVITGPEVETDHYNFEMLNVPKNHSARDMQDTFYIDETYLLRTHTSPVQVREMLKNKDKTPIRMICNGKVFRRDEDDATHSHQFMQIEGLVIDENISIAHLKGTLEELIKHIFGSTRNIRLRPSYFPFTEPSVEVDVDCFNCNGVGCNICKHSGWIEVLGAGMIHPNVLQLAGYDSTKYSGFAFGLGVERFVMLKYGVKDIRDFYTNDIRFIEKFDLNDGGDF